MNHDGVTISLCMIVKNEERTLPGCLACLKDLVDEMVIVDTGSTDGTVDFVQRYAKRLRRERGQECVHLYHFDWIDDFAAARNFAFSKATGDYIYSADADETIDAENVRKFHALKEALDPRIEIVQMIYDNEAELRSVYNTRRELRPKLFRRLRTFTWESTIHEKVRTEPVVYDSDIVILHRPKGEHAGRDLANFRRALERGLALDRRLFTMYAREVWMGGSEDDFLHAEDYFAQEADAGERSIDEIKMACCVAAHAARLRGDFESFMKYAMKCVAAEGCSEICCELGDYYLKASDPREALLWYTNAALQDEGGTESLLDLRTRGSIALSGIADCYKSLGDPEQEIIYRQQAAEWVANEPML